jgi:hypothetical protein
MTEQFQRIVGTGQMQASLDSFFEGDHHLLIPRQFCEGVKFSHEVF